MMTFLELRKGLGPDDYIVFANTGAENEETLVFVNEQSKRWGVKIWWIERPFGGGVERGYIRNGKPQL